ncbi:MAG: ion transporter [Lachnospiraceae bacterium]
MRKRIFEIIEISKNDDVVSKVYDIVMLITILLSIVPLAFRSNHLLFYYIDKISVILFIIDYVLRLLTADYKLGRSNFSAFILYPFTPMALVDLLAILPSRTPLNGIFRLLKIFRFFRALRVFRIFKFLRYSKSFQIIKGVFTHQRESLSAVCGLAVGYVLMAALVIYNVEPASFDTFFDAVYWATVSLTTMGYGDIYPISTVGRVVTMISSFVGIAIVALPASIITAGYMEEITDAQIKAKQDLNVESNELSDFLDNHPDYQELFEAAKNVTPEHLTYITKLIQHMNEHLE